MRNSEQSFSAHLLLAIHNFAGPIIFLLCHLFFSRREVVGYFVSLCVPFLNSTCFSLNSHALYVYFYFYFFNFQQRTIRIVRSVKRVQAHSIRLCRTQVAFPSHTYSISYPWQCPVTHCCSAANVCSFSVSCLEWFLCNLSYWSIYKENTQSLFSYKQLEEITNMDVFFICLWAQTRERKKIKSITQVQKLFSNYLSSLQSS